MNTERMRGKSGCLYSKKALFWGSPDDDWMYFECIFCVAVLRKDTTRLSISQNVLIANSKTKESVNSTTKLKERNVVARYRLVNFDVWYENCKPVL